MNLIKNGNIALAFLLEMYAIYILSYWGFTLQANKVIRTVAGLSVPIVMILAWSFWCAPSSDYRLQGFWLVLIKCLFFSSVLFCLADMRYICPAIVFGLCVVINLGLSIYFKTI